MYKINNIKTEKTQQYIEREWSNVKAKKINLLASTDWTQLSDVNVSNKKEFSKWRKQIRDLNLNHYNSPNIAFNKLEKLEKIKPSPIFENFKELKQLSTNIEPNINENILKDNIINELGDMINDKISKIEFPTPQITEQETNNNYPLEYYDLSTSRMKIHNILIEKKNKELLDNEILSYPIIKERLDQASDYLVYKDNLENYPLLNIIEEDDIDTKVKKIINKSKQYFKTIMDIENTYLHLEKNVYNMEPEDINNFFEDNGYRYRCKI